MSDETAGTSIARPRPGQLLRLLGRAPLAVGATALLVATTGSTRPVQWQPRPLSAFDRQKADLLLRSRLPCLGCHMLDGTGGRLGSDLSDLGARLPAGAVHAMITDPQRVVPGTIMPKVPMSPPTLDLIVGYLLQHQGSSNRQAARPSTPGSQARVASEDPTAVYGRFCAPCHGVRGAGDGPNAPFLPVRPTAHASKAAMSARSDDALFDAIFTGGFVMNRSNFMPPFGMTLERDQIWGLVRHIRSLCRCEGPDWSRDNR